MSKKNFINQTHIEGLLYDHSLELKVSGQQSKNPGTQYIAGVVEVATDNDCLNVVPVHFSYVTATTKSGKQNATYNTLRNIIDGGYKTIMGEGKENATPIRIDSAIGLNEFYSNRDGEDTLVSVKRNEGGFVHIITDGLAEDEKTRNTFKVDMVITNCRRIEADPEKDLPEKVIIKGAIFDFRKSLLPVEFTVLQEKSMNYFEDLGVSNKEPVFTTVWGKQISQTIVRRYEEESAFGDNLVREVKSVRKDFVITGASKEPYAWDDEETITAAELAKAMQDRELYLATLKKNAEEYRAKQNTPAATLNINPGQFNF